MNSGFSRNYLYDLKFWAVAFLSFHWKWCKFLNFIASFWGLNAGCQVPGLWKLLDQYLFLSLSWEPGFGFRKTAYSCVNLGKSLHTLSLSFLIFTIEASVPPLPAPAPSLLRLSWETHGLGGPHTWVSKCTPSKCSFHLCILSSALPGSVMLDKEDWLIRTDSNGVHPHLLLLSPLLPIWNLNLS